MSTTIFSAEERERYARHILLKEIGGAGQQRLKAARIAIVGAGGLGAPAALYLAAAGVGTLRIIDDDAVSLSNLQRQVLYRADDVGAGKVERAAAAIKALNPNIVIDPCTERLTDANAAALLAGFEIVLDGSDSFATRFAVNAACHALGARLVSGAVGRWEGQAGVFASGLTKDRPPTERSPCYRCFVPEAPENAQTCAEVGIVGALTGVIGSMMALEAIKAIAGAGETLDGRLFLFDGLSGEARTVRLTRDPACVVCGNGA